MFLSFPRKAHFLEIEGDFVAQAAAERQTEEDIKVALRSVIVRRDDDVGLRRDADGQVIEAGFRKACPLGYGRKSMNRFYVWL